ANDGKFHQAPVSGSCRAFHARIAVFSSGSPRSEKMCVVRFGSRLRKRTSVIPRYTSSAHAPDDPSTRAPVNPSERDVAVFLWRIAIALGVERLEARNELGARGPRLDHFIDE